ncbi:hypothetical protein NliqN6_5030 [Naganishia liquefaciens]|uniref:Uncharacterized protein n=1 Tax=Naganishia liquefaciens TaxID=104408 RepID=A0A8H3YGT1_9TREE|nr:hypothetical protein NliqN6_5030 [Naganishia liquefaciens]
MSSRPFTPADLFKALELIQFVGCQTQHQLIAALRMLIPLIDTELRTTQTERHRGSLPHTFANEGTCSTPSFTAYHLQVDRVLNTVIEMYTERKISSRAKKKKASERGRHEVGQKLGMVEDLFLEQPIILRAFDVVRLRYNLPPRSRNLNMDAPASDPLGFKPVSSRSLSVRTCNQEAGDGKDIKAHQTGDLPFCKSYNISLELAPKYDEPPQMRSRESISSFETEDFVAKDRTETDTPFQLFWRDESRTHATPRRQAVNYSLPKSSWQPVHGVYKDSLSTEDRSGAADGDLPKALESSAFSSVRPSLSQHRAPSTPVLSEQRSEPDSASSWELAAFDSDSQSRTVQQEPKAQSANTEHVQLYPAAQDTTAVDPSQYKSRSRFECKESLSAATGFQSHNPEQDVKPNGLWRSMRRDLPLGDLWSHEVLLRTAQRESRIWPPIDKESLVEGR